MADATQRPDAVQRREQLKEVWSRARGCTRCPQLVESRRTVVFGAGNADADLMFVGEAPGANEDRLGLPFVGQAGALLERLLAEIGLRRDDVFIANVLKCRPPGNRDPLPQEIDNCQEYLYRQLELVRPKVVCTLGNFATKLLRADPATGITRLHGREEERVIGPLAVRLYPLLHPAAALYTPAMLEGLRSDFGRIPALLALERLPDPPAETPAVPRPEQAVAIAAGASAERTAGAADPAPDESLRAAADDDELAVVAPGDPGDRGSATADGEPDEGGPETAAAAPEDASPQLGLF